MTNRTEESRKVDSSATMPELVRSFASPINRHSLENDSNTPDFILAEFLIGCLHVFGTATRAREDWYKGDAVAAPPIRDAAEPVAPDDQRYTVGRYGDLVPEADGEWVSYAALAAALSAAREDAAHALASSMDWREKEQHQHDRAEAAEADLARARQIIGDLTRDSPGCFCEPEHQFYCSHCKATAFLAEGDKGAKG